MATPPHSTGQIVLRVVGGVLGGAAAVVLLLLVSVVLRSVFGTDPARDPHGYGAIFGTVLAIPAGLIAIGLLPLALPAARRAQGYRIAVICGLVVLIGLVVAFLAGT